MKTIITREQALKVLAQFEAECIAEDVRGGYLEQLTDIFIHGTRGLRKTPNEELQEMINDKGDEIESELRSYVGGHASTPVRVTDDPTINRKVIEDLVLEHEHEVYGGPGKYLLAFGDGKFVLPSEDSDASLWNRLLQICCKNNEVNVKVGELLKSGRPAIVEFERELPQPIFLT
jgi:hypothetical protein